MDNRPQLSARAMAHGAARNDTFVRKSLDATDISPGSGNTGPRVDQYRHIHSDDTGRGARRDGIHEVYGKAKRLTRKKCDAICYNAF